MLCRARRAARDGAAGGGGAACGQSLLRSRRGDVSRVPPGSHRWLSQAALRLGGADARTDSARAARPDPARALFRPQFDRRLPRLSASLRLLLQGRVLRGWTVVLYATGGRCARRDRAAAGPASVFPGRSSPRQPAVRDGTLRRPPRHGPAFPGRSHRRFGPPRRSDRARGRGRAAQPLRGLRITQPGQPAAGQQGPEPRPRLSRRDVRMQAEGRILTDNWDRYDTRHVVYRTRGLSEEQLEAGYWCSARRRARHRHRPEALSC